MLNISEEVIRRALQHLAVLNRWQDLEKHKNSRQLFREYDVDFIERTALTYEELQALLLGHRDALRAIAASVFGRQIDAIKALSELLRVIRR